MSTSETREPSVAKQQATPSVNTEVVVINQSESNPLDAGIIAIIFALSLLFLVGATILVLLIIKRKQNEKRMPKNVVPDNL